MLVVEFGFEPTYKIERGRERQPAYGEGEGVRSYTLVPVAEFITGRLSRSTHQIPRGDVLLSYKDLDLAGQRD